MALKLYELTDAYAMLLEADADSSGEGFGEALAQLGGEIAAKGESLAKIIRTLEAESDALKGEIDRLGDKKAARDAQVRRVRDYLKDNMEAAGLRRIDGTILSVALQDSPPSCTVLDAAEVPLAYQEVVPATMKILGKAIIDHWKATGEQVAGALVRQTTHIRIR